MVSHRVLLTGGGTGGHVYPALAVAEQLRQDSEVEAIVYVGAQGHIEEKLAGERGLEFVGLSVSGLPRKLSGSLFTWPFQMSAAVAKAQAHIRRFSPTVVLGTGGYASAPPLLAAMLNQIPYAIHEPDAHPGKVNRLFARNSSLVSCGMEGAMSTLRTAHGRVVVNGNPVSASFLNPMKRDAAAAILGIDPHVKTVLITGGSQGARGINDAVRDGLKQILAAETPVQIIHQVGAKNLQEYRETLEPAHQSSARYVIRDYFDDLSLPYAVADLAVCRAGAMTIAELAVVGCPAIFVPYPFAAGDHQSHNAAFMASRGAAVAIAQDKLSGPILAGEMLRLLTDEDDRLRSMSKAMKGCARPQAALDLATQLKEVSTRHQIRRNKEAG
jgi:UDP-N-acetylglucosamine--N-acetylmuramyl-(pentapeptide) pyrophosphoryl-undecaprenol N-acetylglucosamine transferase